jgi:prepilin-type N-terminal cleavage/methylation domain-containing protein
MRARRGFSILELVVVLIMIGILAAMAVPRLNYERYRADGAMRVTRTLLQGAQRSAIMRQTNVVVGFDVAARQMVLLEDADNDCVQDINERKTVRTLDEGAKFKTPPSSVTGIAALEINGTNLCTLNGLPAIQFLRDGAASSDLEVYITSSRGTQTDFRAVTVIQATGRTDSFRYSGSVWKRTN